MTGGSEPFAPADLVQRFDPALFACLLFAPEPGRARLMTLTAFDIELSRAEHAARKAADTGPLLAQMRLQFWRDRVAEAYDGQPPRAHEVAEPLARLIAETAPPRPALEAMIDAREMELGAPLVDLARWAEARFGGWIRAGTAALGCPPSDTAGPAAQAMGRAFLLRTAAALARAGTPLLPSSDPDTLARLARETRADVADARTRRSATPRVLTPLYLPLAEAERRAAETLADPQRMVERGPSRPHPGALRLIWPAMTGRW
ncbi:MAG: squalene/phytoene synthase family protein [Paracoccaceae bacterium]